MHAFSGCRYWTFTIHCEHCGHMIFRLGYCSEMQLMQHWDHQFNWHCTEYTLTINETKMTRYSSFHTISWFCFCLRCGVLAHPGQLHHEHCHRRSWPVENRSRYTRNCRLYFTLTSYSPISLPVYQFWPDCYDHVSKEGAVVDQSYIPICNSIT